jgi:hypothetical protein
MKGGNYEMGCQQGRIAIRQGALGRTFDRRARVHDSVSLAHFFRH